MLEPGETTTVVQRFDYLPAYASSPTHKYTGSWILNRAFSQIAANCIERGGLPVLYVIGLVMFVASLGTSVSATQSHTEQRIQRIRSGISPAVLVQGEVAQLTALSSRMEALRVPGVSIAVIHDGKLEWARGFGSTRVDGPPVAPETLFQAASISKPVTALAVMSLEQSGQVDLDADVNQYLKTWKLPSNEFTQRAKVTLRGLLTHSAGVTVQGFGGYEAGASLPSSLQILNGEVPANSPAIRVDAVPGKIWRYSGGGYVIVQQLLTDVTRTDFPKLMHDLVLKPLGMQHSAYEQPLPSTLLAQTATPYRADGTPVPGGPHVYPELAAAGLWTTPSDIARYAIAIQEALSGRSKRVLSPVTARAMLTPAHDQQALGLLVGGNTARKYFVHDGANAGYRCFLVSYQQGDGAVIMTNSDNGDALITEIIRTIAREYAWPDFAPPVRTLGAIDPQSFDRYVGAYQFPSGEIAVFWRDGTHRKSKIGGKPAEEIFPTSEREYFYRTSDARLMFAIGIDGVQSASMIFQNGQVPLKKLDNTKGQPGP